MRLSSYNISATIIFNFKLLPFKEAIRFPFLLGGKVKFEDLSGRVVLPEKIKTGMVRIGFQGSEMFGGKKTVINLEGTLVIKGHNITIGVGSVLDISKTGKLILDSNVCIGALCNVCCASDLEIGSKTITSWNCSINAISNGEKLSIGEHCWLGNNVEISGFCDIPHDTIFASKSSNNYVCSKPEYTSNCVVGGGKVLQSNQLRTDDKIESE